MMSVPPPPPSVLSDFKQTVRAHCEKAITRVERDPRPTGCSSNAAQIMDLFAIVFNQVQGTPKEVEGIYAIFTEMVILGQPLVAKYSLAKYCGYIKFLVQAFASLAKNANLPHEALSVSRMQSSVTASASRARLSEAAERVFRENCPTAVEKWPPLYEDDATAVPTEFVSAALVRIEVHAYTVLRTQLGWPICICRQGTHK